MHLRDSELLLRKVKNDVGLDALGVFSCPWIIHTLNPYSYTVAKGDLDFRNALASADTLLPDGMGIVIGVWLLDGERISKVTGPEMHDQLLNWADRERWGVFHLGASQETLAKIGARIAKDHPGIRWGGYSPPFKEIFSSEENDEMIAQINAFAPQVLFVGMTAPKQEKWVEDNRNRVNSKVVCTIGAAFDYYAGTVREPPRWMRRLWLEWAHRILTQPGHMWKRYKKFPFTNVLLDVAKLKIYGKTKANHKHGIDEPR